MALSKLPYLIIAQCFKKNASLYYLLLKTVSGFLIKFQNTKKIHFMK